MKNITKIYRSGPVDCPALNDVSITIHRGEMLGIVGSSGSGKSTLMNILGFLDQCTRGEYWFAGSDVTDLREQELSVIRNRRIGFIFQSFCLLPRLSVLQNVMLPLLYRGMAVCDSADKGMAMLERFGIHSFFRRKPGQLSGGQQQRVAIARALVNDPDLILADEPTGALDSRTGQDVMTLLTALSQDHHCTVVIVTHDPKVSAQCSRVVRLSDGSLVK